MSAERGSRDPIEADLEARVAECRREVRRRVSILASGVESRFDIFEPVRRKPVTSVLTAGAAGVLLGTLSRALLGRSSRSGGGGASSPPLFSTFLAYLPSLLTLAGDVLRMKGDRAETADAADSGSMTPPAASPGPADQAD